MLTEIGHRLLQVERERDEYQAALERSEHTCQRQAIELSQTEENLTRQAAEAQRFRMMNQEWRDIAHAIIDQAPRTRAAARLRDRLAET